MPLPSLVLALALLLPAGAPGGDIEPACHLTAADKAANAQLSFDDFDQKGVSPVTWRRLSTRGCHALAVEAAEDYLVHGRFKTASEQRVLMFHIGQSLGMSGKYEAAALMVAATKTPASEPSVDLDWNTYVDGTWAFLKRDKAALTRARDTLAAEPGKSNEINGSVLTGLLTCFDRPYEVAYGSACRKAP